jgi:hypothetical protein
VAARQRKAAGWTIARCRGGRDAPWRLAARSPGEGQFPRCESRMGACAAGRTVFRREEQAGQHDVDAPAPEEGAPVARPSPVSGRGSVPVATRLAGALVPVLGEPEPGHPPTEITGQPRPVMCHQVAHRNGRPPPAICGSTKESTWSLP